MILCLVIIIIDTVEVSTPPAPPSDPAKQDSTIACSNLRKWGCYLFMIFLAVLAGVTINHFVVEKNTNDVEKITSITSKLTKYTCTHQK